MTKSVNLDDGMMNQSQRQRFRREAVASWTSFQETGQHLTGQEVKDWLASWGAYVNTAIPECHD